MLFGIFTVVTVSLPCAVLAEAADVRVTIRPGEPWSAVFGETEASFHFDLRGDAPVAGLRMDVSREPADHRSRRDGGGRRSGQTRGRDGPLPSRRQEGLVFETQLECAVYEDGSEKAGRQPREAPLDSRPRSVCGPRPVAQRTEARGV